MECLGKTMQNEGTYYLVKCSIPNNKVVFVCSIGCNKIMKKMHDLSLKALIVWNFLELGKVALLFMCQDRIRCCVLAWFVFDYLVSRLINFMGLDSSNGDP